MGAANLKLQQWRFDQESQICIGRGMGNQVMINHALVSRHHLELQCAHPGQPGVWQLTNHGLNGTLVNGAVMVQGTLKSGDLLQLAPGGPTFLFKIEPATPGQPSPPVESTCTHSGNPTQNLFCMHCGQAIAVKQMIRQYQILRPLGQGGMGTTYLACRSTATGSPELLVLKEMNADLVQIAKAHDLFQREAQVLRSLRHPGIPKFYDFFVEAGKKYLVMELIHGEDLEDWIVHHGPVTPQQAVQWMLQTCDVLHYLHQQTPAIIHRDIKPANLLVRYREQAIAVLDFGAVKELGTPPGTRIAIEGYSAPEQDQGNPVIQSDLYAVGSTLVFLITGESPHQFYRRSGKTLRLQVQGCSSIPRRLQGVIEKATEPNPSRRYVSAQALAIALKNAL
ncbi:serine/threonine protein kinase [Neosynechococcus sphagnicola sy1]|uniref:Serine/threonine protein kinase n=1 Tax=Neosynechococcus sphagnicola sy1 TaxID=1497020 RepID=A0A098THR7_9CYAN|nr:serine/threonine protein kinase [Neosynechococcus sphagnicola sy1]